MNYTSTLARPVRVAFAGLFLIANSPAVVGQGFSSGSDGSMGALVVSNSLTLDVPPDGRFHFTTVTVPANRTLTFNRNALNTPVYLLATSNVTISGTIDISGGSPTALLGGRGGPGGFDGGAPTGAGHGPGGGLPGANAFSAAGAGSGSYSRQSPAANEPSTNKGAIYGSPLLVPMVGGSGGGGRPDSGGGGGGGALVIASSTRIDFVGTGSRRILANGGFVDGNAQNYGSGGAVRLVAPVVAGSGTIDVTGPVANPGRVRIDTVDLSGLSLAVPGPIGFSPLSIGAFMTVFPPGNPRLDIIEVAGIPIPEGTNSPVTIILPVGSDPNRTVVVRARNFGFLVQDESTETLLAVEVVLTPDTGRPTSQFGFMSARSNPNTVSVPVTFPINTPVTVSAWQR